MERISGYVNIFKADGLIQTGCAIYADEKNAIETGKMIKGYKITIPVMFEISNEEIK